jgi:hypothetical protein
MAGNLVKLLLSLYGTEWRERGYGLRNIFSCVQKLEQQGKNSIPMASQDRQFGILEIFW